MNFLKRALLAVTRKRGKTFIMFVIFAAIANMVLAGYAIQHATEYASALARQKLGGELTLKYNMQGAMEKAREQGQQGQQGLQRMKLQSEPVTEEMVSMIASQENIVNYNYIVSAMGIADGFEPVVTEEEETDTTETSSGPMGGGMRIMGQGGEFVMPDVSVSGVLFSDLINTFTNNEDKLVDGRHITNEDSGKKVAMIEKNLAEQNSLKVGDKIKIKSTSTDDTEATTVEFSIVGIYETGTTSDTSGGMGGKNFSFTQPYNKIIVDFESAKPLKTVMGGTTTQTGGIDSAIFYVDDPKNIDKVKADAEKMNIDWEKYTLDANDLAYQQMMGPIDSVASFSSTVIYIVAIAGAIILALILTLSIKERMYETGVLLSMGEGKGKIIAQYVTEVLIIALVAFSLSVVSGKYIAQGVGDVLLDRENQIVQDQEYTNSRPGGGRGMGMGQMQGGFFNSQQNANSVEAIDSLDIRITLTEVENMAAAGLLIIIAGTMIPAANVMRFKPKTILTKAT